MSYDFKHIEHKWQQFWKESKCFKTLDDFSKPKYYSLVEFPYPSGQGLHVGHPRSYTAMDILSRKRRMQGYNVMYPMGWDAFGLPTENFAIKNNIHPEIVTKRNISNFKNQLQSLGISFDWDREINTTNPSYYKWTQWIFIQLFKHGLAYKKEMNVNWCIDCKVVLANEEVISGSCERCGANVIRKQKSQWMLKITDYAQKLLDDLVDVDYSNRVKLSQQNWIGRSQGAEIKFLTNNDSCITVYTTRPDTIFGVTYLVVAPEHSIIDISKDIIKNYDKILAYRFKSAAKSEFERTELIKEKDGVIIEGLYAIHPITNQKIPIFVSDYVLISYGTGSIMAVPAHDSRDNQFALKYGLEIKPVIYDKHNGDQSNLIIEDQNSDLVILNSDFLNNLDIVKAKTEVIKWLESNNKGKKKVNFKIRDWIFSRQRYWGEPIPIVHCEKCGYVAVPEAQLPLTLPKVSNYAPNDNGNSPLADIDEFINTICPDCGCNAKRESDTMPQWAGSSWYFIRYCDPFNNVDIADKSKLDYWLPVDWYNGGMEHTTLHLLYSRFWHKFLYDIGVVSCKEPYLKRTSHGMILGENGEKMSKSRGNVVSPDTIIDNYGADTLRLYEMFIGDFEKMASWNSDNIKGCKRFLDRVWNLLDILVEGDDYSEDLSIDFYKTIKKVSTDIENLKFNTAISSLMSLLNLIYNKNTINKRELFSFAILLSPFAPHIAEELHQKLGYECSISTQNWLSYDESKCIDTTIEMVIQINGKTKSKIIVLADMDKISIINMAKSDIKIANLILNKVIIKEIYVPNKLVNIVIK